MDTKSNSRRKRRVSLVDRLELRLSTHKHVDGLWVGTYEEDPEPVLRRVEEALDLIKAYDRLRYDRLTRDLERVWVRLLFSSHARFNRSVGACELDIRYVLAATSSPAEIAAVIVHEATHARLMHCGIGYEEEIRARVEAVCIRRELAFAKKLPNGAEMQERAQRTLEWTADNEIWTNPKFEERTISGALEAARYLGVPIWLTRAALAGGRVRAFLMHQFSRLRPSPQTARTKEGLRSEIADE